VNKPFTPKLGGARPRLGAALDAPTLNQFTPKMLAIVQNAASNVVKQKKPLKDKTSVALKALTGNF
jgi:hypothetical protein